MANELQVGGITTGVTVYAVIHDPTDGTKSWALITNLFELTDTTLWNLDRYTISLTERPVGSGSGYYVGTIPATIPAGVYPVEFRIMAGAVANITDEYVGGGWVEWDGDAILPLSGLPADILAAGDVDGYSLEETLKLCLAALAGKLSGAATTTIMIRAADDSKTRITATVDSNGNRTAITLDETG